MWTHILGMVIVCALLAKKVKNEQKDLGFMSQLTLFGANAVEWLKDGTTIRPHKILLGQIQDLISTYDINFKGLHLEPNAEVFLLFERERDRPLLVYQKSAMAQVYRWLSDINCETPCGIDNVDDLFDHDGAKLGTVMIISNEYDFDGLHFVREEGKFGKYTLNY